MKKLICVILVIMLLSCVAVSAVACNRGLNLQASDKNLGNYKGKTAVSGMSAFDLVMEAYDNFLKEPNYTREEYFEFSSSVATRKTHLIRKIVDGKIYNQEVIYGTGFDKGTCAKRFYYDGNQAMSLNNTAKKNVSYDEDTGKFTVKNWGEFKPFTGDLQKELYELKDKITTYNIMSREMLSPKHNDGVYKTDGVYYCTIKINCSEKSMKTDQKAALQEFLDTLGAKQDGFEIDDTTIDFAIAKIDGAYKFLIWKRNEKYAGNHASFKVKISCEQTCISYYTYGNAVITKDDLLNLAK